jgi:VWFA-related protein
MWVYAQSPQPIITAPTLKVYARETVVDVNVTDAKGNPVHGLTQADFTVKEDGKSQAIRSFEEFGTQPVQPLPKLPPNTYTNLQPPPASSAVNILLLDGLNTAPPDATSLQAPNTTAGATPSGLRPASPVFTSPTA